MTRAFHCVCINGLSNAGKRLRVAVIVWTSASSCLVICNTPYAASRIFLSFIQVRGICARGSRKLVSAMSNVYVDILPELFNRVRSTSFKASIMSRSTKCVACCAAYRWVQYYHSVSTSDSNTNMVPSKSRLPLLPRWSASMPPWQDLTSWHLTLAKPSNLATPNPIRASNSLTCRS